MCVYQLRQGQCHASGFHEGLTCAYTRDAKLEDELKIRSLLLNYVELHQRVEVVGEPMLGTHHSGAELGR